MQCTAEEIERKRQVALERLGRTQQSPLKSATSTSHVKLHTVSSPYEKCVPPSKFFKRDKVITGNCTLISRERFRVELSDFSSAAIEVFKTIPNRYYDTNTKYWNFHIQYHDLLCSKLMPLRPGVVVERIPKSVVNYFTQLKSETNSEIDLTRIESELYNVLMPFQLEGVLFGIERNGRCLIADDMGLGKTFQALAIASYYSTDWPLLIVTTASMKNVWEETIHNYLPSVPMMVIQYMVSGKDYIGDSKILIVSHDLMSRYAEKLLDREFGTIIVDESHTIKNPKAKCTKAALLLANRAQHVILLSGTPALSRPSELYTQLTMIDGQFFGNFFTYSKRYCDGRRTHFGWDASGKSNLQELEIVLNKKFMIRRTKEDILKTLPNKIQQIVTLDVNLKEFSEQDKKCLKSLADKYNREQSGKDKHQILLNFFQETAKIKIPSVCCYILQILQQNEKFIVFAHHQKMLDAICSILIRKSVNYIRIDGNTNSQHRKFLVDKFQLDDKYLVAVLSITAANAGITLTSAKLVIFAELHWNPSILSQAESRAHRIGQTEAVIVRYLIAPGTADDPIWMLLQEKQKVLGEVGLSKDSFQHVSVTKQNMSEKEQLPGDLDLTIVNTLDISTYFSQPDANVGENSNKLNIFDDGFDDVLGDIDI